MINVHERDSVTVVQMDHGKVNALDVELLRELTRTIRALGDANAVVLTGNERAFSAGVDLRRIVAGGAAYVAELLPALSETFLALFDCPRPLVAAVNGHAIAGGAVIVQACDRRLMSAGTIGITELLVGVPFPPAALEIVRHRAGRFVTELVLTGRTVSPDEARSVGLVDEAVDPGNLIEDALLQARTLARVPRTTFALTKEQLNRPARERVDQARAVDDQRVIDGWADEVVLGSISTYLDQLAVRRAAAQS